MPNGIALSAGEDLLYVSDTTERNVKVYNLTASNGPTKGRVFATTSHSGGPDGLKCDSAGNVWVCEDEGILVFNPKGQRRTTIVLPESPSNCAFSHQGSTLFVTAKTSVYAVTVYQAI